MRKRGASVDVAAYGQAVVVLVRNPVLLVPSLVAALLLTALGGLVPSGGGLAVAIGTASTFGIIAQIIEGLAIGFTIIGADLAWRKGRCAFDEMIADGQRRAADIVWAAFGFNFVPWAVVSVAGSLGLGAATLPLTFIAIYFLIYTLAAAAIGGIQGFAALSASVDQAKMNALQTLVLTVVYLLATLYGPEYTLAFVAVRLAEAGANVSFFAIQALDYLVFAIFQTYVAIVMAKIYGDVSLRGFFFR